MKKNTQDFFKNMVPFLDFNEIMNLKYYKEAPLDWSILITDIRGSTGAISLGRYKEVNMLGASCIAAIVNIDRTIEIPFVFGGDGATFLFPNSIKDQVMKEVRGVQKMAQNSYNMELRAGIVKIADINSQGKKVIVSKLQLSDKNFLAQFQGGGLQLAEEFVKNENDVVERIFFDQGDILPNLQGLSCRWAPFKGQRGLILCLLVKARNEKTSNQIYTELLLQMEKILGESFDKANPIKTSGFHMKWPPVSLKYELRTSSNFIVKFFKIFWLLIHSWFSYVLFNFNTNVLLFSSKRYKKESTQNADFKKFDDMLRMVIDCTIPQKDKIENILEELYKKNEIYYGTQPSKEALMTCFVQSLVKSKHMHFVDGADGGYALAAKKMKEQISSLNIEKSI